MKTAITKGTFIVPSSAGIRMLFGTLIFENDKIIEITENPSAILDSCTIINGTRKIYLPGLINTHGHTPMSLLRGYSDDVNLSTWFSKIWPIENLYDNDAVKWASLMSIAEMIQGGTTTFLDMYDRMDQIASNVEASGIRACLTRGIMGLCSEKEWQWKIKDAETFIKNWNGKAGGRISSMVTPHSPYACPPPVLEKLVALSIELNLPMHMHLSETQFEVEEMKTKYGMSAVKYLWKNGILNRPCLFAHAVHVDQEEIDLLAQYSAKISHNPGSNLKLASGVAPLQKFFDAGISVSLGTDGAASNNNLDMFEEMRLAALIHKGVSLNAEMVSAPCALEMATKHGAHALELHDIGTLSVGMKADIIAIDMDQPHFYPNQNMISHLVYSASAKDVTEVWVDGKYLLKNRELQTIDMEKTKREFNRVYSKLFA